MSRTSPSPPRLDEQRFEQRQRGVVVGATVEVEQRNVHVSDSIAGLDVMAMQRNAKLGRE